MLEDDLRLIKYESIFLSTRERYPDRDPTQIRKVTVGDDKDDNLFPSLLPPPPGSASLPALSAESSERKRYGYPICWSQIRYEWYPYLPAVVDFRYPIFRGMSRNPDIVHNGSGYSMKSDEIGLWQNIEYVMYIVAQALSSGKNVTLQQRQPELPSEFGYARNHTMEKFARKCVIKSLNAFQRYLGFCAYAAAGSQASENLGDYSKFYADSWVLRIHEKIGSKDSDIHVLTKLLLSSLWHMRAARNHTGVVVSFQAEYSYPDVGFMRASNVPVYVAWPGPNCNPYTQFYQHHNLSSFIPGPELFQALENPHTSQPAATSQPIRYGPPPVARDTRTYDHPLDYVKLRLERTPGQLERAASDRLKHALKFSGVGTASFYRFDPVIVVDSQTGQQKERWTRTLLTKHDAKVCFEDCETTHLWFDCISNQWNYSEHLNIKANLPSDDPAPPSGGFDETDVPESHDITGGSCLPLEEGELVSDLNEPPSDLYKPPSKERAPKSQGTRVPSFNTQSLLQALVASQFSVNRDLSDSWTYEVEFQRKRYGLTVLSDQFDDRRGDRFPVALGLRQGPTDTSTSALYESAVGRGPLPYECDLSEGYSPAEAGFPLQSPNSVLKVSLFEGEGYLVTVTDGAACPWKLLISDPLTLIQIERENWHLQRDGLVLNLIQKGLPFKVLYPSRQQGTVFYPHPGPVVHPDGKAPAYTDYLAYCLDVADFFRLYPHAHAAALCAGGILWRIAIDALPLPAEHQVARPFHSRACTRYMLDNQPYWTPKLTEEEEMVIVGVFRWARLGGRTRDDSWWPKPGPWASCGLEFGVWAPADEDWYSRRKETLLNNKGEIVASKEWRGTMKFQRPLAGAFLDGMRAIAREFISQNRL